VTLIRVSSRLDQFQAGWKWATLRKKSLHSVEVKQSPSAFHNPSAVRSFLARMIAFSGEKACSIGSRSRLYGGMNIERARRVRSPRVRRRLCASQS
jgi:hypothetical protein